MKASPVSSVALANSSSVMTPFWINKESKEEKAVLSCKTEKDRGEKLNYKTAGKVKSVTSISVCVYVHYAFSLHTYDSL